MPWSIKNQLPLNRLFLGSVFVVSGWQKLMSPYQNFAAVIEKFEVFPDVSILWLAQTLPWIEFIFGVFFILGLWERLSRLTLWTMNTVFIGVIVSAIARKLPIQSCGCFGEAIPLSLPQALAIDCALWILFLKNLKTKVN